MSFTHILQKLAECICPGDKGEKKSLLINAKELTPQKLPQEDLLSETIGKRKKIKPIGLFENANDWQKVINLRKLLAEHDLCNKQASKCTFMGMPKDDTSDSLIKVGKFVVKVVSADSK